ncbi:Neopullulanase / Cyclomaltodextrinase / Maltogenic alpha-amylase [Anopheles sinensis]|uniref:Neopullulanase / Cyclomaltodextrinase / Maltogenic alpha-amylase n=1 Tax=Anopheles sinensis TaxID=74873 RepID=A0A084VBC2_ANOSI|nr:Neopullulanase / Cyclomaltodextrinase / Maltogenic alpha-amylase [Anopheles sinensis]
MANNIRPISATTEREDRREGARRSFSFRFSASHIKRYAATDLRSSALKRIPFFEEVDRRSDVVHRRSPALKANARGPVFIKGNHPNGCTIYRHSNYRAPFGGK